MGKRTLNRKTVKSIPFFAIFGAEDDDNPPKDKDDNKPGGKAGDDDDDDDDEDDDSHLTPDQRRIKELSAESKRRRLEARGLQKELDKAKADREEQERKKNDEATNNKNDLAKANKRIEALEKTLHKNLLETAILKHDSVTFHDTDTVLSALDRESITLDLESGTVEGLSEELKRVAKDKPFLVKATKRGSQKQGDQDEDQGGRNQGGNNGRTGNNPGGAGGSIGGARVTERDALIKKYKL